MQSINPTPAVSIAVPPDIHQSIWMLTRQLHDSLNGLGLTDKVKGWAGELPDAKSRLSYIARLTGEAAEKVLNRVDQAKAQHDHIAAATRRIGALIVKDPVAAVAKGDVMNFLTDVEESTKKIDQHLTEIMMAQDFHDLTGQVMLFPVLDDVLSVRPEHQVHEVGNAAERDERQAVTVHDLPAVEAESALAVRDRHLAMRQPEERRSGHAEAVAHYI